MPLSILQGEMEAHLIELCSFSQEMLLKVL